MLYFIETPTRVTPNGKTMGGEIEIIGNDEPKQLFVAGLAALAVSACQQQVFDMLYAAEFLDSIKDNRISSDHKQIFAELLDEDTAIKLQVERVNTLTQAAATGLLTAAQVLYELRAMDTCLDVMNPDEYIWITPNGIDGIITEAGELIPYAETSENHDELPDFLANYRGEIPITHTSLQWKVDFSQDRGSQLDLSRQHYSYGALDAAGRYVPIVTSLVDFCEPGVHE